MTGFVDLSDSLGRVTPSVLSAALSKFGWRLVGGKDGLYSRWTYGDDRSTRILIPLDDSKPDFSELLTDAISSLTAFHTDAAQRVLRALAARPGDELKFHKDSDAPTGTIRWDSGQGLIQSASNTLIASAKASSDRRPAFRNSNWFIAREFLQSVLMGQTEIGSYVVTAYAPPDQELFERESQKRTVARRSSAGIHTGREVVEVMTGALQVTREVIDQYHDSGHVEEFDAAVEHGVSKELAVAVQGLVKDSDGASIKVEWSRDFDALLVPELSIRTGTTEVEFSPTDYPILERASIRLGSATDSLFVTVVGSVEVLTRKVGSVGVVAVNVLRGTSAKKVRVRLPAESYEIALEAHRRMDAIKVTGRQERSGNYYWLYDAHNVEIVELYNDDDGTQGRLFE
ncbi:hypothetical protein [Amycolatopsis sp. CA-230715]|uniref:hypothetical protein n=1 Tax=Amycolatopsis sp. CA-230715 TaxID=2745196 RepID=UPI001C03402B|nr:hypothetical protein [Amycolatopsis sp. CA-230715]QWF80673.1 hypothetical protein HUW46_04096 [Amycolatopsis sp. CA-230715]